VLSNGGGTIATLLMSFNILPVFHADVQMYQFLPMCLLALLCFLSPLKDDFSIMYRLIAPFAWNVWPDIPSSVIFTNFNYVKITITNQNFMCMSFSAMHATFVVYFHIFHLTLHSSDNKMWPVI
jgi:hypothetical protein